MFDKQQNLILFIFLYYFTGIQIGSNYQTKNSKNKTKYRKIPMKPFY